MLRSKRSTFWIFFLASAGAIAAGLMTLGDITQTLGTLCDGVRQNSIASLARSGQIRTPLSGADGAAILQGAMQVNAYLINTGEKLVLIDTGAAKLFGPTLGNIQDSIKAAGYTPEQVDEIYITHMHADHVGGLMAGDKLAFPNAIVRSDKRDADFWPSKENLAKAREAMKGFFPGRAGLGQPVCRRWQVQAV